MLIERYEGKNVTVEDIETAFNAREREEYAEAGREVEIWTTVKTRTCGCSKRWVNIYFLEKETIVRHSRQSTPCANHAED